MSVLTLTIEILPGASVKEAIAEMIKVAKKIDVPVSAEFNNINVWVTPQCEVDDAIARFEFLRSMKKEYLHLQ